MSFNFEELEREDKIREIEYTIERLKDQIEAGMDEAGGDDEIAFSRLSVDETRQVIVHFIKWGQVESYESCEEILTIEDAKIAIREAAEFRDRVMSEGVAESVVAGVLERDLGVCRPVEHGDLLVLPCTPCYYIAYAAVVDQDKGPNYTGFQQKDYSDTAEHQYEGGQDEEDRWGDSFRQDLNEYMVKREFLVWNVSSQTSSVDIGTINSTEGTTTPSALATLNITELSPTTTTVNAPSLTVTQTPGNTANLHALTDIIQSEGEPCEDPPLWNDGQSAPPTSLFTMDYVTGDYVLVMDNGVKRYFYADLNHTSHETNYPPIADGTVNPSNDYWTEVTQEEWCDDLDEETQDFREDNDIAITRKELNIGTLEAQNIGTTTTGPYTVGVYEPQPEGTPVQFDALTSIETLSFTAGSTSSSGNLDSIAVTTASTGVTGVVFKDSDPSYGCSATKDEHPCWEPGAVVDEGDVVYDPTTQKYYQARSDESGTYDVTDTGAEALVSGWEEITPATTPSNCLVLDVHDYTEKQVTVAKTTLPYAYGATTISGTAKARPITITPQDFRLEATELTFSKSQAYLNTSSARMVVSNHLQNLLFKTKPFSLTPSTSQFTQQMNEIKLESEQLRLESVKETGDLVEYTVSIHNKKLKSDPCGALSVSISTPVDGKTFTIKGFEPDGSTQTVTKDLFSPTVTVTPGSSSTYTVGGVTTTVGAEQETLVELSLANISIGAVTAGQQILLSNMDLTTDDPCEDPDPWDTNVQYEAGDYVMYGGSYWKALQTSQATTPSTAVPTYWEEMNTEEYCDDTKPLISNSKLVVGSESTTALTGTGPSTFQLTGSPTSAGSDNFKSLEIAVTPRDDRAYIPMLSDCPVDNVTVEAFAGENPVSLAGSTRVSISASGSCDLVIQNQIKIKTKSYDIKCGVLANTDDVCPEETVVTNDMVVDAFTTQGYTEQELTQVWKTPVEVCDGSDTVTLHLLHVDPEEGTSGQTCAGWFIPCEYDSSGEAITQAPRILKKDDTGELSLLSLDCS